VEYPEDGKTGKRWFHLNINAIQNSSTAKAVLVRTDITDRKASEEEIRSAAFAMPFLATQRLVVLTQPLSRAEGEAGRKRLVKIMDELPESTLFGAGD